MENAPAGTNDYVYPGLIEQKENAALDRANNLAVGEISNPIVRDTIPELDLNAGGDTGWSGDAAGWAVGPSSDGPGEYEVYEIDSDTGRADDRTLVVYGFEVITGGEFIEAVHFNASDGQTFERAQLSGLDESGDTQIDRQKTLRSPVDFGPQENGTVDLIVNDGYTATGDDIELKLLAVTAEKMGRRVGTRN